MGAYKDDFKRNLRFNAKNIKNQWKQYLCLFIAVFVVQMMFWMVTVSYDTDVISAEHAAKEHYDTHLIIRGLTEEQHAVLSNTVYYHRYEDPMAYDDLRIEPYIDLLGRKSYHVYVRFSPYRGSVDDFFEIYMDAMPDSELLAMSYTPLYEHEFQIEYTWKTYAEYGGLMLLLCAISVFLLMVLYDIRIRHHRFSYGIYSAFGADFPKLYSLAVGEMLLISLAAALPSVLSVLIFSFLSYGTLSVNVSFGFGTVIKVLIFHVLCVMAAVYLPVKRMSTHPPVDLIRAQNNARLVYSPRRSFSVLWKISAFSYESMSVWRFHRYYLKLIASATAFSTLFLCGIYVGNMVRTHQENINAEFIVSVHSEFDSETITSMEAIEGVDYVLWSNVTPGFLRSDHLLLTKEQGGQARTSRVHSDEVQGYPIATNRFAYIAFDRELIDVIVRENLYEIEGDPYSVLNEKNTVIISDSVNNTAVFNFQVDDKVIVASYVGGHLGGGMESMLRNEKALLHAQIDKLQFEYTEYTIGAVIHDNRSDQNAIFGLSEENYAALADDSPQRNTVSVYMETDADLDTVAQAESAVFDLVSTERGCMIAPTYATFDAQIAEQRMLILRVTVISVLMLSVCPLIWFFSQIPFFSQREMEWEVLRMFGICDTELRNIHRVNGIYALFASVAVTLSISYLGCSLLFRFCNFFLNAYGFGDGTKYVFHMSLPALMVCVGISMVCGYLSSVIPYYLYRRKQRMTNVYFVSDDN